MDHEHSFNMVDEVAELVRTSLTPQSMVGMGAGSELDRREYAVWRSAFERRWHEARRFASGRSPEATRLLDLVGAEYNFHVGDKVLRVTEDGCGVQLVDAPWLRDEFARETALDLARTLPQKFRAGQGTWKDVEEICAAVLRCMATNE